MTPVRIQRPKAPTHLEPVLWRAPQAVFDRFNYLMTELVDTPQDSDRYREIIDEVKGLQGYPHWATEDRYIIHTEATDNVH